MIDREMEKALEADGEKLRAMTGEDHGPHFLTEPLPLKCCGLCARWRRENPADTTAPEGRCSLGINPGHWPTGYWPATLQRDRCRTGFSEVPAHALAWMFRAWGGRI